MTDESKVSTVYSKVFNNQWVVDTILLLTCYIKIIAPASCYQNAKCIHSVHFTFFVIVMKKIISWILIACIMLSSVQPVVAGSFYYVPTKKDVSLLETLEKKVQEFQEERLPILQRKIEELWARMTTPRARFFIDTVLHLIVAEPQRRASKQVAAVQATPIDQSWSSVKTLSLSEDQQRLLSRMKWYRYNAVK